LISVKPRLAFRFAEKRLRSRYPFHLALTDVSLRETMRVDLN